MLVVEGAVRDQSLVGRALATQRLPPLVVAEIGMARVGYCAAPTRVQRGSANQVALGQTRAEYRAAATRLVLPQDQLRVGERQGLMPIRAAPQA